MGGACNTLMPAGQNAMQGGSAEANSRVCIQGRYCLWQLAARHQMQHLMQVDGLSTKITLAFRWACWQQQGDSMSNAKRARTNVDGRLPADDFRCQRRELFDFEIGKVLYVGAEVGACLPRLRKLGCGECDFAPATPLLAPGLPGPCQRLCSCSLLLNQLHM